MGKISYNRMLVPDKLSLIFARIPLENIIVHWKGLPETNARADLASLSVTRKKIYNIRHLLTLLAWNEFSDVNLRIKKITISRS